MKLAFALCGLMASEAMAQTRTTLLGFGDLPGWEADDHDAALAAFLLRCLCAIRKGAVGSARPPPSSLFAASSGPFF